LSAIVIYADGNVSSFIVGEFGERQKLTCSEPIRKPLLAQVWDNAGNIEVVMGDTSFLVSIRYGIPVRCHEFWSIPMPKSIPILNFFHLLNELLKQEH
jgi:hypothetical protein